MRLYLMDAIEKKDDRFLCESESHFNEQRQSETPIRAARVVDAHQRNQWLIAGRPADCLLQTSLAHWEPFGGSSNPEEVTNLGAFD